MNENTELWNPAKRLHEVLVKAKKLGQTLDSHRRPQSVRQIFGQVFDVSPHDTVKLYKCVGLMIEALEKTAAEIGEAKLKYPDPYIRNFPNLKTALEIGSLDHPWPNFGDRITEQALADLLHASTRLCEIRGEENLEKAELKMLAEELAALVDLIHSASINNELRAGLLEMLLTCSEILAEYRIRGGDALRKIVETATGHLVVRRARFATPEEQGLLSKIFSWLVKADEVYTRLGKYVPLLSNAGKFLSNGKE